MQKLEILEDLFISKLYVNGVMPSKEASGAILPSIKMSGHKLYSQESDVEEFIPKYNILVYTHQHFTQLQNSTNASLCIPGLALL